MEHNIHVLPKMSYYVLLKKIQNGYIIINNENRYRLHRSGVWISTEHKHEKTCCEIAHNLNKHSCDELKYVPQ